MNDSTQVARYKAAVIQTASVPFELDLTVEKAAGLVRKAASEDARLAVFPEALLGAYPKGSSYETTVGSRKPAGRQAFEAYHQSALDLDGPSLDPLLAAVSETGLFVVIGCIERDVGTLYCTALFIDGDRGLVGKHRKLMPTGAERLIWGFGDGSTLPIFDTSLGRIGAVICWENYMPMLRMAMYDKGISIYCAPTADDRDSWVSTMRHVALEGRCFVLSACQHITRGAYPADYQCDLGDDPDLVLMRGGSMIVGPLGDILAGPDYNPETILYAEIDLGEVVRGKYDFDVAGHYARPDVFNLTVDERARRPVTRVSDV